MAKSKAKDLISDEDMKPENIKITISMRMSAALLDAYREEAERLGIGYQTLMQMKLKEGIERGGIEARLEAIEKKLRRA